MKDKEIEKAKITAADIANHYTMNRFNTASKNGMSDSEFYNFLLDDIKSYTRQVLDYAAEKAKVQMNQDFGLFQVDKQSILNIKEEINGKGI